jgi:hypothetical protein
MKNHTWSPCCPEPILMGLESRLVPLIRERSSSSRALTPDLATPSSRNMLSGAATDVVEGIRAVVVANVDARVDRWVENVVRSVDVGSRWVVVDGSFVSSRSDVEADDDDDENVVGVVRCEPPSDFFELESCRSWTLVAGACCAAAGSFPTLEKSPE